jgi:peroxiredoxin
MMVACAASMVLASCGRRSSADADAGAFRPLEVGTAVPSIEVMTLAGDSVRIGAGEPLTLLNVWATWCTECREEMADLEGLKQEFAPRGLRVIGVSVDRAGTDRVRRFAETERLSFIVAHDPAQAVQQAYQIVGVPETLLIGRDGRLLWRVFGNIRSKLDSMRTLVAGATQ